MTETEKEDRLFAKYATYFVSDKLPVPEELNDLVSYHRDLEGVERRIEKTVQSRINNYDIYTKYLKHIKGIGPMFSANLIAMLSPIERFPKPSSVTAYVGLTGEHYEVECKKGHKTLYSSVPTSCRVRITLDNGESFGESREPCGAEIERITKIKGAMKRKKGYTMMINTNLKTLMFKIGNSFEKQSDSFYRNLYVQWKNEALARYDPEEKGYKMHARLTAIRKMSHRFLIDLYVNWMYGLGSEKTPYEATMEGHTIIPMELDDGARLPQKGEIKPIDDKALWSIKRLFTQYYDVQKLRIASFNQIVSWCKENRNILPEFPEDKKKD